MRMPPRKWLFAGLGGLVAVGLLAWGVTTGFGGSGHPQHHRHERGVPAAFQGIRWRRTVIPPMCGFRHAITTKGSPVYLNTQTIRRRVHPAWRGLSVEVLYRSVKPKYGTLVRHRNYVAVMVVGCAGTSGTADGFREWNVVIYGHRRHRAIPIATLPTLVRLKRPELATIPEVTSISRNRIVIREFFYGSADPTNDATGRAIVVWTLRHGVLFAHVRIERLPRESAGHHRYRLTPRSDVLAPSDRVRVRTL